MATAPANKTPLHGPADGPLQGPQPEPARPRGRSAYSIFVSWMKFALPAMACALIILVVAWPQLIPEDAVFQIEAVDDIAQQAETLSMLNAKFSGFDEKDRPFTITADVASQKPGESDAIDLLLPKADITLEDGAWLAVTAKTGSYERDAEQLHLEGSVNLFHDEGFEMRSEEANVDLTVGRAWGNLRVEGQGPAGTIESEGFEVLDNGARILFTGQSHMLLYPGAEEAAE